MTTTSLDSKQLTPTPQLTPPTQTSQLTPPTQTSQLTPPTQTPQPTPPTLPHYNIEGDIDFYTELYKSLHEDDKNTDEKDDGSKKEEEHVCLISNMPFTENHVKLPCKHSFNYLPLFKDLVNYKKKYLLMESTPLKISQIRCPYCREKHDMLLPFYEGMAGVTEEHGVNCIDETKIHGVPMTPTSCCFIVSHTSYNGSPVVCNNYGYLLQENNKYYCNYHKYKMIKSMQKKSQMEAKAAAKEAEKKKKILEKEEEKKKKLEAKKMKEAAKLSVKKQPKQPKQKLEIINLDDNVILSNAPSGCVQILKSGERKGQCCGASSIYLENMCMRHYKMTHKSEI
jgi:hypothetical protein